MNNKNSKKLQQQFKWKPKIYTIIYKIIKIIAKIRTKYYDIIYLKGENKGVVRKMMEKDNYSYYEISRFVCIKSTVKSKTR